jgi:hypothetical protein
MTVMLTPSTGIANVNGAEHISWSVGIECANRAGFRLDASCPAVQARAHAAPAGAASLA